MTEPDHSAQFTAYCQGIADGATRIERDRICTWLRARALRIHDGAECPFTDIQQYAMAFGLQQAARALEAGEDP